MGPKLPRRPRCGGEDALNVAGRVELYLDERVIDMMRNAESERVAQHRSNRGQSPEPDPEPHKDAERRLIAAMKQQPES